MSKMLGLPVSHSEKSLFSPVGMGKGQEAWIRSLREWRSLPWWRIAFPPAVGLPFPWQRQVPEPAALTQPFHFSFSQSTVSLQGGVPER